MHIFLKYSSGNSDLMITYSLLMSVFGHESQGVLFCKRNVSSALDLSIILLWKIKLSG